MSAATLIALSVLVSLLVPAQGHAEAACSSGQVGFSGRIERLEAPKGSGLITARLTALRPTTESTINNGTADMAVVLEGVIVPARTAAEGQAAMDTLATGLVGTVATLLAASEETDRHDRRHGALRLPDGSGLAEQLLAAGVGLADVSLQPCASRFLQAEAIARKERHGIWRQSRLWTDLNRAAPSLPDFVLGRGRVASVGLAGRTTYINFGDDFRTDATVRLGEAVASALIKTGRPPETLAGRQITVRGWATARNGLDMELASPEALDMDAQ